MNASARRLVGSWAARWARQTCVDVLLLRQAPPQAAGSCAELSRNHCSATTGMGLLGRSVTSYDWRQCYPSPSYLVVQSVADTSPGALMGARLRKVMSQTLLLAMRTKPSSRPLQPSSHAHYPARHLLSACARRASATYLSPYLPVLQQELQCGSAGESLHHCQSRGYAGRPVNKHNEEVSVWMPPSVLAGWCNAHSACALPLFGLDCPPSPHTPMSSDHAA